MAGRSMKRNGIRSVTFKDSQFAARSSGRSASSRYSPSTDRARVCRENRPQCCFGYECHFKTRLSSRNRIELEAKAQPAFTNVQVEHARRRLELLILATDQRRNRMPAMSVLELRHCVAV